MNRRRSPEQVVVRRKRARLAVAGRVLLALVGMTLVTGAGGWGIVRGWKWLHSADRFALRDAPVTGTKRASPEDLLLRGGLIPGVNVIGLDLAAATSAMEAAPWVKHVRLTRELPDVRVGVQEHEPAAMVWADGLLVVSPDGTIIKDAEAADSLDLPVLTGFDREQLELGHEASTLRLALSIIEAYGNDPMHLRARLEALHLDRTGGEPDWTVFLGEQAVKVTLGVVNEDDLGGTLPAALVRVTRVWDDIRRRGAHPRNIDVGNRLRPEWVPARFDEALPPSF